MKPSEDAFFRLLRVCVGTSTEGVGDISPALWNEIYEMARQQSLLGIVFYGLQKSASNSIEKSLLLQWFAVNEQIRQRNAVMYRQSARVSERLLQDGFRSCILKGQGNAMMYPDPYIRMSGDIDVWVKGSRDDIMAYARKYAPHAEARCYHVDFPVIKDVPIELHFVPSVANNWMYRRRMNRYFERMQDLQCSNLVELPDGLGRIPMPTREFNIVYQLSHIMHHFFDEGIGLRQMMDYYYLVKSAPNSKMSGELDETLRYLGLRKFAGAVMYILKEVFGMEEKCLIVPADEWRGRTLLEEILQGGNFGQHSGLTQHGMAAKYFLKIKRNMRFVRQYPAEALCEPVFRTWHFFWRMRNR